MLDNIINLTLKFGSTLAKVSFLIFAVMIIVSGFVGCFTFGFITGILGIITGLLMLILSYYVLFLFIDIHAQLVKLNEKMER